MSTLGEHALLLEPRMHEIPISIIHKSVRMIEAASIPDVTDIIPSYESIALVYGRLLKSPEVEIKVISNSLTDVVSESYSPKSHNIVVCYELGMDWEAVEAHTGLEREKIIHQHLSGSYEVAMMGFLPGFLYLSGLNDSIACPRREEPRTKIPAGSVGIGGHQTGIYSLESPGGWQIIGRTPYSFFDAGQDPPTKVRFGDQVVFERISEDHYTSLKGKDT